MTNSQTLEAWQTQMNDQTREFEILDNILSYQMTNDLNVCQLVNKKWFSESQKHKHGNATVPIFCEYYNRDPQPLGIANGNRFYPSMKTLIDHSNTCITKYFRTAQKQGINYEIKINEIMETLVGIIVDVPTDMYEKIENIEMTIGGDVYGKWYYPKALLPWITVPKQKYKHDRGVVSLSIGSTFMNQQHPVLFLAKYYVTPVVSINVQLREASDIDEQSIVCRLVQKITDLRSIEMACDTTFYIPCVQFEQCKLCHVESLQNCMFFQYLNHRMCALLIRCVGNVTGFTFVQEYYDNVNDPCNFSYSDKGIIRKTNFPEIYTNDYSNIISAEQVLVGKSTPKDLLFPEMQGTPPWWTESDPTAKWYCIRFGSLVQQHKSCSLFNDGSDRSGCSWASKLCVFSKDWTQNDVKVDVFMCLRNVMCFCHTLVGVGYHD